MANSSMRNNHSSGSGAGKTGLSVTQQDRQARNKPLLNADETENMDVVVSNSSSFEVLERKRKAATILDNPELLMTYADALQDSIAGTRQIFTKILCGYEDHTTKHIWGGIKTGKVPKPTWSERPVRRPAPNLRSNSH